MSRLIDADKLIEAFEVQMGYEQFITNDEKAIEWIKFFIDEIKYAPTIDAVEVVRCENCKWCYDGYCSRFDDLIPFGHENYEWRTFFCSYGERKTK